MGQKEIHNTMALGLDEAFGVWLPLTETELIQIGYTLTSDESRMNVYIYQTFPVPLDHLDDLLIHDQSLITRDSHSL